MNTRDTRDRCDGAELVRFWAVADGTRCVLVSAGNGLELRIVHERLVVRYAPCVDVSFARDTAQMWRVDFDIERAIRAKADPGLLCPECGEQAIINGRFPDSARWLGCAACGNVWLYDTDGVRHER